MPPKIGRNDPCWCGSGKKYKKCHLTRSSEPQLPSGAIASEIRKRSKVSTCLHPRCI